MEGNERAQLAIDIFYRRVIAYIGRYFIALGGVDGQGDRLISTPNSKVKVFVIPTNEELVIARDTKRLLNL